MSTASVPAVSEPQKNRTIAKYLGPAPLIDGEDAQAYQRILEHITATVKPNGMLQPLVGGCEAATLSKGHSQGNFETTTRLKEALAPSHSFPRPSDCRWTTWRQTQSQRVFRIWNAWTSSSAWPHKPRHAAMQPSVKSQHTG